MEVKWRHTVSLNDCGNIQLYGGAYLLWKKWNSILQTKCARHSRSQLSHYAETIPDKKLSIMILILSSQAQHYGCILRSLWVNYSNDDIICRIVWFSLSICAHDSKIFDLRAYFGDPEWKKKWDRYNLTLFDEYRSYFLYSLLERMWETFRESRSLCFRCKVAQNDDFRTQICSWRHWNIYLRGYQVSSMKTWV